MKKHILVISLFFLAIKVSAGTLLDIAKTVHYIPPTNFYNNPFIASRNDPGDNPFSMRGPEFLEYKDKNDRCGLIRFEIGFAGAYIDKGKVVKFLPTEPADLKKYMENECEGKFPQATPVVSGKIDGLASVSLTAIRPVGPVRPYFLHFYWIQIQTNIVIKISAYSCDKNSFNSVTNSLQFIKLDKAHLLDLLKRTSKSP